MFKPALGLVYGSSVALAILIAFNSLLLGQVLCKKSKKQRQNGTTSSLTTSSIFLVVLLASFVVIVVVFLCWSFWPKKSTINSKKRQFNFSKRETENKNAVVESWNNSQAQTTTSGALPSGFTSSELFGRSATNSNNSRQTSKTSKTSTAGPILTIRSESTQVIMQKLQSGRM